MSAGRLALGAALGVVTAGVTMRATDYALEGRERGIHLTAALAVPVGLALLLGGTQKGSVAKGALFGLLAAGAVGTAFVSTFTFGAPSSAAGFFGPASDPLSLTKRT